MSRRGTEPSAELDRAIAEQTGGAPRADVDLFDALRVVHTLGAGDALRAVLALDPRAIAAISTILRYITPDAPEVAR